MTMVSYIRYIVIVCYYIDNRSLKQHKKYYKVVGLFLLPMTTLQKATLTILSIILISILTGFVLFIRNNQTPSSSIAIITTNPAFSATSDYPDADKENSPELEPIITKLPTTESEFFIPTEDSTSQETTEFFPTGTAASRPCPIAFSEG